MTVLLLVAGMLSMFAGCKEDKAADVVQTVEWYQAHHAERLDTLAKCSANPGKLAALPQCVNASRAHSSATWSAKGGGIGPVKPLTAEQINKK